MRTPKSQDAGLGPVIAAVHRVRTGSVEQHPEHRCRTWKPLMWWVLTSRRWVEAPIDCYLIEHRDGLVLFDTGLDPAIVSDPSYIDSPIGRRLLRRLFRIHVGPEDSLERSLAALGFDASAVRTAVVSHLHFDHVGGIAHIPQADLLVSKDEWAQLCDPRPERNWILREHIQLPGAKWRPIDCWPTADELLAPFGVCHDVMGDGSMLLLPTPGHSPGSLSMLVRSTTLPPLLLIGDLAYEADMILNDRLPGIGDARLLRDSYSKVRALRERLPDLVILPAHDPSAATTLESPRATVPS